MRFATLFVGLFLVPLSLAHPANVQHANQRAVELNGRSLLLARDALPDLERRKGGSSKSKTTSHGHHDDDGDGDED